MSHLNAPRICIYGTFAAEGVTANNVLAALDEVNTSAFKPPPPTKNWHNNNCASNRFVLIGSTTTIHPASRTSVWPAACTYSDFTPAPDDVSRVVAAVSSAGAVKDDPVLGAVVSGVGVMADLDPEHRRVTDLIGLEMWVGDFLEGTLRPTQLRDYWVSFTDPVYGVSTVWKSVLDVRTWAADLGRSKVLSELHAASPKWLSVRLALTFYNGNTGKFLAVIGPHDSAEPEQIAAGRRLITTTGSSPTRTFPAAAFLVDARRKKLVVDLGNLVPPTLTADNLLVMKLTAAAGVTSLASPLSDRTVGDWLNSAGVVEWDLTDADAALLEDKPLRLTFQQQPDGDTKVLEENPEGKYADVDRRSLRLNPGQTGSVTVRAWKFGKPLAGAAIPFNLLQQHAVDPITPLYIQKGDPYFPADPQALINSDPAGVFVETGPPFSVTTDAQGRGELRLTVKPGPFEFPAPRKSINSQLYLLGDPSGWQNWGALGPPVGAGCALAVLVFNSRRPQSDSAAPPTWDDVAPILKRYARLYPVMRDAVGLDLGDKDSVRDNAEQIKTALLQDVNDVRYMPVTRDMARDDRRLILDYLASL